MPIVEVAPVAPNQPGAGKVYTQTTDPGAVGAGAIWINTTSIGGTAARPISVRNAANSAWIPEGLAVYTSGVLRGFVTVASDGGIALESKNASGALKSYALITNTALILSSAGDLTLNAASGKLVKANRAIQAGTAATAGQLAQISQVSPLFSITAGALPTQQFVTATGAQVDSSTDREVHTPVTFNPGVATTATCLVELSPDNTTYSALCTVTKPVGVAFDGTIEDVVVRVPATWYLRLTVTNATLGLSTYY